MCLHSRSFNFITPSTVHTCNHKLLDHESNDAQSATRQSKCCTIYTENENFNLKLIPCHPFATIKNNIRSTEERVFIILPVRNNRASYPIPSHEQDHSVTRQAAVGYNMQKKTMNF